MRPLSETGIRQLLNEWTWGTLIVIDGDRPYAIETSYAADSKFIYCSSMPGGRMSRCVKDDAHVAFKVCDSGKDTSKSRAVIIEGEIKRLTQKEDIIKGIEILYKKLGLPESNIEPRADQLTEKAEESSFYRIAIKEFGGRAAE